MAGFIPLQQENTGLYIGTTQVWDVARLYEIEVTSPEFKELLVRLYQQINKVAIAVNLKDTGMYYPQEIVNGQTWFPTDLTDLNTNRSDFRKLVITGALPNAGLKQVPHGIPITGNFSATRVYGAATNPTFPYSWIPLPYASPTLNENISLNADGTNVNITTAIDYSAYTISYVILEYLKN